MSELAFSHGETVASTLRTARAALAHLPSARLDAELLLAIVLRSDRVGLVREHQRQLSADERACCNALVAARARGTPLAYLRGHQEFWSLEFSVNADVLVPRSETEDLVALALSKLQSITQPRIADLGTGSGAIAVALASERPDATLVAIERDTAALRVACRNVAHHHRQNVVLLQADWASALRARSFDVIVANPPYVCDGDPALLDDGLCCEPRAALAGGPDGLASLRVIAATAPRALRQGGWLLLEHGATQASAVRELLARAGLAQISTLPDLAGRDRMTVGQREHCDG